MARRSSGAADRRPALLAAKLRVLVAAACGGVSAVDRQVVESPFPGGAALLRDGVGWILAEDDPARALGPALAWAEGRGVTQLHVLASGASGLLARRASLFARPPSVWQVEGATVLPADPDRPEPPPALRPEVEAFVPWLVAAGADVVVEHGVLTGEVLGLEVARVVVDGSGAHLEVGVGRHDRDAQRELHGDEPPPSVLDAAVAAVRARRRIGAPSHPTNQLARERWLRSVVVGRPDLVGAATLAPLAPPTPRGDLRRPGPAPAGGLDVDGRPLIVVCSVGIDLDLVPAAADARLADGRGARLVLVLPEPDAHAVTRWLAAALGEPADVVTVAEGWEALTPAVRS